MQKYGSSINKLQNRLLYSNLCIRSVGKRNAHSTKCQSGRKTSERTAKPFETDDKAVGVVNERPNSSCILKFNLSDIGSGLEK